MTMGVVGRKAGMTRIFTEDGAYIPVTVIEVTPNRVTQVKSAENDGYRAVALMQLCIAALLLVTLPVWKKAGGTAPEEKRRSVGVRGALKIKGVPYLLAGFFGYCAAEATAMQWASTLPAAITNMRR